MSVYSKMTAIADEIRDKTGKTEALNLDQMAESIPEVYTAGQSSMVDESKLIPKTVSGSYISVDDVSEIPHSVGCKVESANLFDNIVITPGTALNGISYTLNEDKSLTLNGTTTATTVLYYCSNLYLKAGTYTLNSNLNVLGGSVYVQTNKFVEGVGVRAAKSGVNPETFELTEDNTRTTTFVGILPNTTLDNVTIYPMLNRVLNRSTTALPYTPYVKPEEVKVTRCGKNIVDILNGAIQYKTVTIREKTENTIVLSCTGTYKGVCYILPKNLVGKYLTVSGEWDNANGAQGGLRINWIKTNNVADLTVVSIGTGTSGKAASGLVKPPPSDAAFLGLMVYGNSDGSIEGEGVVSYRNIQVEINDKATEREPYNGQTLTPSTDGTVEGMTSVSPYMNVFSDTEGVNIEATYNKSYGMQTEYDRFWDAFQRNGELRDYDTAFSSRCWNAETFKPKYTVKPKSAWLMFRYFNHANTPMDVVAQTADCGKLDFSECSSLYVAFYASAISRLGTIDARLSTSFTQTFEHSQIETIDKFIIKEDGTSPFVANTFGSTYRLKNITFEGVIGTSINFKDSPLSKASITNIINTLSTDATGQTLTLKLSAVNTAFETSTGAGDGSTSAEFAALVATKTNWTITMI